MGGDLATLVAIVWVLALPVGFCLLVWCVLQPGGPLLAAAKLVVWFTKSTIKHPPPFLFAAYWAVTADWFPYELRIFTMIVKGLWVLAVLAGFLFMGVDAVQGPLETRMFMTPNGPVMERARMKEKRPPTPRLDKAVKAVTPARDQLAYRIAMADRARNDGRAAVGLPPVKQGWAKKKLVETLPTGKVKDRPVSRSERKELRRDARAEVADRLPPPPPAHKVDLVKRPRAGVDPAAPKRAPRPAVEAAT